MRGTCFLLPVYVILCSFSFYCSSQVLRFFVFVFRNGRQDHPPGKRLRLTSLQNVLYSGGLEPNPQYLWGLLSAGRQCNTAMKHAGTGGQLPGLEFQLHCFPGAWFWGNYLTLCASASFTCKTGTRRVPTPPHRWNMDTGEELTWMQFLPLCH